MLHYFSLLYNVCNRYAFSDSNNIEPTQLLWNNKIKAHCKVNNLYLIMYSHDMMVT